MENFRLKVFRTVAEQLSFRKAAELLHLSQPAISQHIHALEEQAGLRLFDRAGAGNRVTLTSAGRVLLDYAQQAAHTMAEAEQALAGLKGVVSGELRLGASTTVAQYILPRMLGAFLKQYPLVRLSVISGNTEQVVQYLADAKIALGLIEGPALRRDMKTERLLEDRMILIVAANHIWARTRRIALDDLRQVPLLMREPGSGSRRVVEQALKRSGLRPGQLRIAMELDSTEAIVSGVEVGLGVGFVSQWAIGKAVRLGTIVPVRVDGLHILRDFSFLRPAGPEPGGTVGAFRRFAKEFATDLAHVAQTAPSPDESPKTVRGSRRER